MDLPLELQDVFVLIDCGSLIVRHCEKRDLGSARLCSSSLRSAIDACLETVDVTTNVASAQKLLSRLPSLRQLSTDRQVLSKGCFRCMDMYKSRVDVCCHVAVYDVCRMFTRLHSYTELRQLKGPLQQQLASLTRCATRMLFITRLGARCDCCSLVLTQTYTVSPVQAACGCASYMQCAHSTSVRATVKRACGIPLLLTGLVCLLWFE
jgi:hypothetical protein